MTWKFFLTLIIICLIVQGFFAMVEMAAISFNKVRLQYYVSKGSRRARWLSDLLHNPGRLFGTALLCINGALLLGSEASRHFYESLGISPAWAPLSQVFLVIVLAEVAPLFAGRRYAEHAAMLGVPILYFVSILLRPVIWLLDLLCKGVYKVLGTSETSGLYLSREEFQKILEEQDEFNTIVSHVFSLKNETAKELMKPLSSIQTIPSLCTIAEMRALLTSNYSPFVPIFHKEPHSIVAVAYPRDLLRLAENKRVRDYARPPWFITETDSVLSILKQFQRNNQSVAVVLDVKGHATGILTLDEIIDEIFGQSDTWLSMEEAIPFSHHIVVDRTLPGDMLLSDFNAEYQAHLEGLNATTLGELVTELLDHPPSPGESVKVGNFEITVEESTVLEVKSVNVKTLG
ncbi:MAG: HlyC/CorC family transporter [Verrucomicrobia bacterium]|nr:HlyC/CorC family transporter [Verrucomicrobiota bacterium]